MSNFEAFPLFSPSQMSRSEEKVLHSIFSPSQEGNVIPQLEKQTSRLDVSDNTGAFSYEHGQDVWGRIQYGRSVHVVSTCGSKSSGGKIGSKSKVVEETAGRHNSSPANMEESKVTSGGPIQRHKTHPGSALRGRRTRCNEGIPRSVTFRSDTHCAKECTPRDSDCFRSPGCSTKHKRFDVMDSPYLSMSPISLPGDCSRSQALSIKSTHTNTSWHSVPVEMLNIEFVSNCESERQLENVISALTEASPAKFPSLLRMAKARLEVIQKGTLDSGQKHECGDKVDGTCLNISVCSGLDGIAIEPNETSSLLMNISTSIDGKQDDIKGVGSSDSYCTGVLSKKPDDYRFNEALGNSGESCRNKTRDRPRNDQVEHIQPTYCELKENLATVLASHSSLSAELENALIDRDEIQRELENQTRICRDLECKIKDQSGELSAKIISLQRAKNEAQKDIATLEDTLVSSSAKARDVALQLTKRTEEVNRLGEELRSTKDSAAKELVHNQKVQKVLREKIEELSSQLTFQEARAAEKLDLLEQQLRAEFEKASEQQKAHIASLSATLVEARRDIDRLKKKNIELSQKGKSSNAASAESGGKSNLLQQYNDALAQVESTEMAASAMAKALALSESELAAAKEGKDDCGKKAPSAR
mmetsp:Transcript_47648/g.144093  ORF Transcript_47648/g.144093 Transcript_47648/m.144093 type:complete len:646 (-) Transcript_47648:760-2697(-)